VRKDVIYTGDNLEILKNLSDNSVDSVVTDPPYGLGKEPDVTQVMKDWLEKGHHDIKGKGFMGKKWDAFVPQPKLWKECLRVLKPGGHLLSFAGTRTYDWVVMGLRFAGFEIRDMIGWLYGSGFPKSHDVSKGIDNYFGVEREVVGKHNQPAKSIYSQAQEEMSQDVNITAPSSAQAKQWQGWGTALKPAIEPIVMARKPLEGTVAENVLEHGVGGLNIDGCRVEHNEPQKTTKRNPRKPDITWNNQNTGFDSANDTKASPDENGRFPANIIHDDSDDVKNIFQKTHNDSFIARKQVKANGMRG